MSKDDRITTLAGNRTASKDPTYKDAGVDIDAGNALVEAIKPLASATKRPGADGTLGGFGGLFDLKAAGFADPILIAANDGVGTKLKVAIDTGLHGTVGIDLVAMCVNDLIAQGGEPLFFLDYYATGSLTVEEARDVIAGISEGCIQAGCALIGGESAEMPGMYEGGDYDLAGFAVGAAERGKLLPRDDIIPGDILIGLRSSGLHSNGYSLIRRIITQHGLDLNGPCPFDEGATLGDVLMTPTLIYVKPLLDAIRKTGAIKAVSHITGGGFPENIPRMLPGEVGAEIDLSQLRPHPIFGWLAKMGNIADREMLRTFNCGIGMVLVADAHKTPAVRDCLEAHGIETSIIGTLSSKVGASSITYSGDLNLSS